MINMIPDHISPEAVAIIKAVALDEREWDDVVDPKNLDDEEAADELLLSLMDVFENYKPKDRFEAIEIVKANIRETYKL